MRRLLSLLGVGALALFMASPVRAGPLTGGTVGFQLGTLPPLQFTFTGTGTAIGSTSASLSATVTGTAIVSVTTAPPISGIWLWMSASPVAGTLTGSTPGNVGGAVPFPGFVAVQAFGAITVIGVPMQLGAAFTATWSGFGNYVTAIGGPWTVGQASVTGVTGYSNANGVTTRTVFATGSNNLVGGAGVINLVAPVKVLTNIGGNYSLAGFGTLSLTYVPEPGTLVLFGSGIAGLALLGRRRTHNWRI